MKKLIENPVKSNKAHNWKDCEIILKKIESALMQKPENFNMINEALFSLTSPDFKYPNVEKCCKTCTAPEQNIKWKKALDELKKMEGITDIEELNSIFQLSRLHIFGIEDY